MRIGIDSAGSDLAPLLIFEAVLEAAEEEAEVFFSVLTTSQFAPHFAARLPKHLSGRIELLVAQESIEMHDEPLDALKRKKNSTLLLGMALLKKDAIQAFVSAGNTGALVAAAALFFQLLPEIKRPALLATLPTAQGPVAVLDVGGNLACRASHLLQFALMGTAYQKAWRCLAQPKVGLLNVGAESQKGTSEIRKAYQLLLKTSDEGKIRFLGNIEGHEVFQGKVDVLVTDGFAGNILLKAAEGLAAFMLGKMKTLLQPSADQEKRLEWERLCAAFNKEEAHGAVVCGIDKVLVKCHGTSSKKSILNGIRGAITFVKKDLIGQMKRKLSLQACSKSEDKL